MEIIYLTSIMGYKHIFHDFHGASLNGTTEVLVSFGAVIGALSLMWVRQVRGNTKCEFSIYDIL